MSEETKIAICLAQSKTQNYINQSYLEYISEAGFAPIVIPMLNKSVNLAFYVSVCDGVILPGGVDIDPTIFGRDNLCSMRTDPKRDQFELEIIDAFLAKRKKIFGICRGFQLLFRYFENSFKYLYFLQDVEGHSTNNENEVERNVPVHFVEMDTHQLYGTKNKVGNNDRFLPMFVNSMHHQGVIYSVKTEFFPEAIVAYKKYSPISMKMSGLNFVIEAIKFAPNVLGVQWHPEELKDYKLLQFFFNT